MCIFLSTELNQLQSEKLRNQRKCCEIRHQNKENPTKIPNSNFSIHFRIFSNKKSKHDDRTQLDLDQNGQASKSNDTSNAAHRWWFKNRRKWIKDIEYWKWHNNQSQYLMHTNCSSQHSVITLSNDWIDIAFKLRKLVTIGYL